MGYRVGVDVGGSFTDFAVFDEASGRFEALKVFSRPDRPGSEMLDGLAELDRRYGITADAINYFTHGTTVGVNTVIQRKGLRLALFTTDGFVDVLELARLKSPDMYDLFSSRPAPLVDRANVHGIVERMDAKGHVVLPVVPRSVADAYRTILAAGCQGIVVSLLHAATNGENERQVREILLQEGCTLPIFLSHEVWPIIREYERTTTAIVNGYVQPQVSHYLGSMQAALASAGVEPPLLVTKSNGGAMTAQQGKSECVQMILSGTASGVIGAAYLAKDAGVDKVLSLDIGGTSADVAIILGGKAQYGIGEQIGDFQIHIPSISVTSIGDGGGSIAWIDSQGVMKVGPESAGSTPGPVCYGRGGTRPTITDSFVAAGMLGIDDIGYNAVKLDVDAARRSIEPLATASGQTIEEAAEAIRNICVSGMYTGTSAVISRFGIDPTEFSLLAFGGAGPMLAAFLARDLRMKEVVVPPRPGVLSALGGLVADLKTDFIRTIYATLDHAALPQVREAFAEARAKAEKWLIEDQDYKGEPSYQYLCDLRYIGQSFEVETEIQPQMIEAGDVVAIKDCFHREHERLFGHCDPGAPVQLVSVRLVVSGQNPRPVLLARAVEPHEAQPSGSVRIWVDGMFRSAGLYRRADLSPGATFQGPAIVTQEDTTTVVPPDCSVVVDTLGNLRISL